MQHESILFSLHKRREFSLWSYFHPAHRCKWYKTKQNKTRTAKKTRQEEAALFNFRWCTSLWVEGSENSAGFLRSFSRIKNLFFIIGLAAKSRFSATDAAISFLYDFPTDGEIKKMRYFGELLSFAKDQHQSGKCFLCEKKIVVQKWKFLHACFPPSAASAG